MKNKKRIGTKMFLYHIDYYQFDIKYFFKRALSPFCDLFYKLVLSVSSKEKRERKHQVSICAIFKDEAVNIKEWIEFHLLIGVDHFYMYNNFSTDNYLEVLSPYIHSGVVTLIEWPYEKSQFAAYQDFYKKFRYESQWVSYLDLDEFINLKEHTNIHDWLAPFKRYSCVVAYWKMFGTSGLLEHDQSKLTIEQYTLSWPKLVTTGKVFINTDFDIVKYNVKVHHETFMYAHVLGMRIKVPPINEFRKFICWGFHRSGARHSGEETIQINHYWSKSFNYYMGKKLPRGPVHADYEWTLDTFFQNEMKNNSTDYSIFRFLILLRNNMNKN